jgi:intracellular multiplication protein IcmO
MCILDEYGYYAVKGFAVVPAQARSLGFSVIFAGQDLPAFQKASKEEAASIGANTNIKICMKLEDPTDTWDFFTKTAGEAYVTKVDSFQTKENSMANSYLDTKSSSFEKRARIDLLDLKDQTEGEAHIFFKSQIVRARMFYANPKPVNRLKLNQFLKVEPPSDEYLAKLQQQLIGFKQVIETMPMRTISSESTELIDSIVQTLNKTTITDPIERSVSVLLAYHKQNEPDQVEDLVDEVEVGSLTIFTKLNKVSGGPPILAKDVARFSEPLLPINEVRNALMAIERLTGEKANMAGHVANELIKDFQSATTYPPEDRDLINPDELAEHTLLVSEKFVRERERVKNKASEDAT